MEKFKYWNEAIFSLSLLVAGLILWQGRGSDFILDDLLHFPRLQSGVYDLDSALKWIFSGKSATGRPIAFLSFLINDNAWPTSPETFKKTNILLHLLNAVLVFILFRGLTRVGLKSESHSSCEYWLPAVAMLIWVVHPIHQSAAFMAIQRMTILMATFSLLALILYTRGRTIIGSSASKGYLYITAAIAVLGPLSAFSKDPGILLCAYALVLEITLFRNLPWKDRYRTYWISIFLVMPLVLMVSYFFIDASRMDALFLKRDFNMYERFLTESRVLLAYVQTIILPSMSSLGPYQDDFVISRGLLQPVTTLLCCVTILSLIVFAFSARKSQPILAFSILWFFSGHLLESTVLPLELYFEHRNYLPSLGIVFGACWYLARVPLKIRRLVVIGAFAYVSLLAYVGWVSARQWSDANQRPEMWVHYHPGSLRAQLDSIKFWLDRREEGKVIERFEEAVKYNPNDAGLHLYAYVVNQCKPDYGTLLDQNTDLEKFIPAAGYDHASLDALQFLRRHVETGRCDVSYEKLISLHELYLSNPKFYGEPFTRMVHYREMSAIFQKMGDFSNTLVALDNAYKAYPSYDIALNQVYLSLTAGRPDLAKEYLEIAEQSPMVNKFEWFWREKELNVWREAFRDSGKVNPTQEDTPGYE